MKFLQLNYPTSPEIQKPLFRSFFYYLESSHLKQTYENFFEIVFLISIVQEGNYYVEY